MRIFVAEDDGTSRIAFARDGTLFFSAAGSFIGTELFKVDPAEWQSQLPQVKDDVIHGFTQPPHLVFNLVGLNRAVGDLGKVPAKHQSGAAGNAG